MYDHQPTPGTDADLEKQVLEDASRDVSQGVRAFIQETPTSALEEGLLPTGVIASTLASTASGSLFPVIAQDLRDSQETVVASVLPSQCGNVKTALRAIIQSITKQAIADGDDAPVESQQKVRLEPRFTPSSNVRLEGAAITL